MMSTHLPFQRILLFSFLGAIVFCALVGIYVFLFGQFGELEAKTLATTLGVCFYSLVAMGSFAALEKRRYKILGLPGLVVCAAGMAMLLGVIWLDGYEDEALMKWTGILALFAFSFAQASLLSLVRLQRKFAMVHWIAYGAIFWLAAQLSAMLLFEIDDEWLFRFAGVLGIVDGCASLAIPILFKLHGSPLSAPIVPKASYSDIQLTCPRCGFEGRFATGRTKCRECGLRLRLEVADDAEQIAENPPFQFSIRSMLAITLLVALGLGLFMGRLQHVRAEWRMTEPLRAAGAMVYPRCGAVYSVTWSGKPNTNITDEHLLLLNRLPELGNLDLNHVPITDRQLALLKPPKLNTLSLSGTQITDEGLKSLRQISNLNYLDISSTQVTDAGLKHLGKLSSLHTVNASQTKVTPQGAQDLKSLLPSCTVIH